MLSEYEASTLQRDMRHELEGQPASLVKCAAGLLILVLLAFTSPALDRQDDVVTASAQRAASSR